MSENIEKAQFLNFLLSKKHGVKQKQNPIIEGHIKELWESGALCGFSSSMAMEDMTPWLLSLESAMPVGEPILRDLVFGVLYSSDVFRKMAKSKTFEFPLIADLYTTQLKENKKYLMEYNSKGQGKVKINAPKRIVTRFPPEPSGLLHIGHAKAALLNQYMARSGEMIVRFDDTNPEKESSEFENAILEDLQLLKITDFRLTRSSDYFDVIFDYACQLIEDGKAYVDNTGAETMRRQRTDGIPSKNRNTDPETCLRIFRAMSDGEYEDYCLRAKISVDNPNKAMRDPVIYRHVASAHHSTGSRYKIYPTYDFTAPILDSIEGVTLTLRTNEYRDRNAQYYWFIDSLNLKNRPDIFDFSRLNFENTVISKRKMKFYVENGYVSGWSDPRMPTLRGLARAGMNMDALREYIISQGASQKTAVASWDKIWALNKRMIDSRSARFSAVPFENFVVCIIGPSPGSDNPLEIGVGDRIIEVPKHKKIAELGNKRLILSNEILLAQEDAATLETGEEFTLMNWGNAVVINKSIEDGVVVSMDLRLNLGGDFKATRNKITWVARKGSVQVKLCEYGNLQNDLDVEDLGEKFNTGSKKERWWLAESAISGVEEKQTIQFERVGFFYCDANLEFNLIPFTKQKGLNK